MATCAESFLDLTPKLHSNAGFMPAFMVHGSIHRTTYAFPDVVCVPSYSQRLAAFQISRKSAAHMLPETVSKYDDLIQHSFLIRKTTSNELSA